MMESKDHKMADPSSEWLNHHPESKLVPDLNLRRVQWSLCSTYSFSPEAEETQYR